MKKRKEGYKMAKKEQNHPIDSRLIFQLLQSITGQQNNNMLYDLLHLDTNEGASFAGKYNRSKNCWWPAQSVWFLNLYNAYY
jgi:hypothetical protein